MGNCLCRTDKKLKENPHIQEQRGDKEEPIAIADTVDVQLVGQTQPSSGSRKREHGDQHDPIDISETRQ